MNRTYILIGLLALLVAALVVAPYVLYFNDRPVSLNPAEWGSFGDYIGGLLNPILSFFALVGLLLTLHEANRTNERQWEYLRNTEKKREWLLVIEHAETQIGTMLAKHVERKDGEKFELGNALKQVGRVVQSHGNHGDRDYAEKVVAENWRSLSIESFGALRNLLGSLARYIEQYSFCLMEENRSEIVSHYNSSYIGYVSALQWMGVMRGQDSERWTKLLALESGAQP